MSLFSFCIVLVAAILHATWNFFAKKSKSNPIIVIGLGQAIAGLSLLPFSLFFVDFSSFDSSWIYLPLGTGFIHAFYVFFLGWGYRLGEISIVYPIARGTGILGTSILAAVFIGDQISLMGLFGVLLIFSGTLLMGIAEWRRREKRGVFLIAILTGVTIACYSVFDKYSVATLSPLFYIVALNITSPLFLTPYIVFKGRRDLVEVWKKDRMRTVLIGFTSLTTYFLVLEAFQVSAAAYVVAVRETSVLIAVLLGVYFLREPLSARKLAAVVAIAVGAILIKAA